MAAMNSFNFQQVIDRIERTRRELPIIVAKETQKEFVGNFDKGGFDGKKWKEPNRRIKGTSEYEYPKFKGLARRTKPTLIMRGHLRRATANSIRQATWDRIQLTIDLPYAAAHNEGTDEIPQRQFAGQTNNLTKKQTKIITDYFNRVWH